MHKKELQAALLKELAEWEHKTFEELSKIRGPIVYEKGKGDSWYEVEIDILERKNDYIHVAIIINDRNFFRSIRPLSTSFIVKKTAP